MVTSPWRHESGWARRPPRSLVAVPRQSLSELIDSVRVGVRGTDEEPGVFITVFDEVVALPCVAFRARRPPELELAGAVSSAGREG